MRSRARVLGVALALLVVVGLLTAANLLGGGSGSAGDAPPARSLASPLPSLSRTPARDPETGLTVVELASLPRQAQQTIALIERGGPFPYAKDGAVFGNRERLLPRQPSGYYREYTVTTPGSDDRGARRIVTGDQDRTFFYTGDHYASFVRIRR